MVRTLAIALALAVGAIVWMATHEGDDGSAAAPVEPGGRIVGEEELAGLATTAGHPVYWAGPVDGTELEAIERPGGGILVRYLEDGVEAGEAAAESLAVGSYPIPNPEKALDTLAARPGAIVRRSPEQGEVVTNAASPNSVYFVDPRNRVQVEVYDPSPKGAMSLTLSGQVHPVG